MLTCKLAPCYGVCWECVCVCVEGSTLQHGDGRTGSSSLGSIKHKALEKGRKSTVGSGSARSRKLEEQGWRKSWGGG